MEVLEKREGESLESKSLERLTGNILDMTTVDINATLKGACLAILAITNKS